MRLDTWVGDTTLKYCACLQLILAQYSKVASIEHDLLDFQLSFTYILTRPFDEVSLWSM